MLALLLNMPQSAEDWARWSFHHRASHDAIRAAILAQKNTDLPDYLLDPIPLNEPKSFLQNNQSAHTDMNDVFGRPGSDLEDVELSDDHQLRAWIYLHWQEHNVMENTLRIGS